MVEVQCGNSTYKWSVQSPVNCIWRTTHPLQLPLQLQLHQVRQLPRPVSSLAPQHVRVHLQLHSPTARTEYFMNGTFHFLCMYEFFCSACSVFFLLFYDSCFFLFSHFATVSFWIKDFEIVSCVCMLPTTGLVLRLL